MVLIIEKSQEKDKERSKEWLVNTNPGLTQLFFQKPPTTFLTCFCRGEGPKYVGKKVRLNQGSNTQPPGHKSNTLTTEPPRRGQIKITAHKNIAKSSLINTVQHNQTAIH